MATTPVDHLDRLHGWTDRRSATTIGDTMRTSTLPLFALFALTAAACDQPKEVALVTENAAAPAGLSVNGPGAAPRNLDVNYRIPSFMAARAEHGLGCPRFSRDSAPSYCDAQNAQAPSDVPRTDQLYQVRCDWTNVPNGAIRFVTGTSTDVTSLLLSTNGIAPKAEDLDPDLDNDAHVLEARILVDGLVAEPGAVTMHAPDRSASAQFDFLARNLEPGIHVAEVQYRAVSAAGTTDAQGNELNDCVGSHMSVLGHSLVARVGSAPQSHELAELSSVSRSVSQPEVETTPYPSNTTPTKHRKD